METLNLLVNATIPILIFYFGYRIERHQTMLERRYKKRIQFDLEMNCLGPQNGFYVVELLMILHNKGVIRNDMRSLKLKVLGIERENDIEKRCDEDNTRLEAKFDVNLINTDLINDQGKYFIEPGVIQKFTYVARIPESIRFMLFESSFNYSSEIKNEKKSKSIHSAQRVFELKPD